MSLRFAVLSLLSREHLTGYDLTKRFDNPQNFGWSAKHSQIYPELAALNQEGLVTFELVDQAPKPNKKIYTITAAGRMALARWMGEPVERRTERDPLLLRTWAVGAVEPARLVPVLREELITCEARLLELAQSERDIRLDPELAEEGPCSGPRMAIRLSVMQAEAYREWLRWAITVCDTEPAPALSVPAAS